MKTRLLGTLAIGALLAACGTNPQERVTGGAAAGAATGAGVGALGGPVGALAGAAIGGGAGAVTGAVTEPSDVNLGRPIWNDPEVRVPGTGNTGGRSGATRASASSSDTRELQRALNQRGFDAGPADGVYGPRTRQAVMDWQRQNNMEATGRPSAQMMSSLGVQSGGGAMSGSRSARSERDRAYMGGGMVGGQQAQGQQPGSGMRDAAGNQMGGVSASGGEGPGSNNMPSTTGRSPQGGTGTATMRDSAGNPLGGRSVSGGEGAGSNNTTTGTGSNITGTGGGGTTRPNPPTTGGAMPAPSNNPMNDPVGGSSQGTRPGFNQNR